MVISGIYVDTVPGRAKDVAENLALLPGVEIHHIHENQRVIMTLEADSLDESYKIADLFKEIAGVLGICLAYTNFEEEPFFKETAENL